MAEKNEKGFSLTDEHVEVLKSYSNIGRTNVNQSFVAIYDTKMKAISPTGVLSSIFNYPSIGLQTSIGLYDSSKFIKLVEGADIQDVELVVDKNGLKIKNGRSKSRLSLVKFEEKETMDVEDTNKISHFTISDEKFEVVKKRIEEGIDNQIAGFLLSSSDIKEIKKKQSIMKHDKFIISSVADGVEVKIPDFTESDTNEFSSFIIEEGVTTNSLKNSIKFGFDVNLLVDDDYNVIVSDCGICLSGVNHSTLFIGSSVITEEDEDEGEDVSNDEFESLD